MPCHGTRKCSNCKIFFKPNPRAKGRQNFCSHPECRKASKRVSQKKWLDKPENRDHFRGSDNVRRVQLWREKNLGYWKRTKSKSSPETVQQSLHSERPLQETLITQPIEKQKEYSDLNYWRKSRLDLGTRCLFWQNHGQPLWEVGYFKHFCHPLGIFFGYFLLFCKKLAYLINIDLSKTFGKRCFAV